MASDQKLTQNSIGRPSVVTPEVVAKLVSVLERGLSISKACTYAHIDRASFYRRYNEDEEFRNEIDDARNFATVLAGEIVVEDILKHRNVQTEKWYLERKDPEEFALKPQVQVNTQKNETYNYFMPVKQVRALYAAGFNPTGGDMMDLLQGDGTEIVRKFDETLRKMALQEELSNSTS